MKKIIETEFEFKGLHGCRSTCHLTIWEGNWEEGNSDSKLNIVLFTNRATDTGTSTTNAPENAANAVKPMLTVPVHRVSFYEKYETDDAFYSEIRFDISKYEFIPPTQTDHFTFCAAEDFEKLIKS